MTNSIETLMRYHGNRLFPNDSNREAYFYALFPPGKLFRSKLAFGVYCDEGGNPQEIENPYSPISLFLCFLEFHHTYTLIHDDLPCMDDDDYRRGRLSLHKKYDEALALLIGDGLLSSSYQLLVETQLPRIEISNIFKLLGPKGLINGQAKDLAQGDKTFNEVLNIHILKTSRLIQVAMGGGCLLANAKHSQKYFELGEHLGLSFQLLDDLCELMGEVSEHEKQINPFFLSPEMALNVCADSWQHLTKLGTQGAKVIKDYREKILKILELRPLPFSIEPLLRVLNE